MMLSGIIKNIRIELHDVDPTNEIYSEDDLTRSVDKTVSLMSRLIPKKDIVETTLTKEIDSETLTISGGTGTLSYSPITEDSLSIPGYTLNTDYSVNNLTGVVTSIGTGLPDGSYTVSYTGDAHMINISALIPDYIKIERIEYPLGSIVPFEMWGDYAVMRSTSLVDGKALRIIYLGKWSSPTQSEHGDYPTHLDDVVTIGSTGQALIFRAEDFVTKAAEAAEAAQTALDNLLAEDAPTLSASAPVAPSLAHISLPTAPTLSFPDDISLPSFDAGALPEVPTLSIPEDYTDFVIDFTDANLYLGDIESEIEEAKKYLKELDDDTSEIIGGGVYYVNQANKGQNVAENYGNYASVVMQGAAIKANMVGSELNKLNLELMDYKNNVEVYKAEVEAYAAQVAAYANIISAYKAEVDAKVNVYQAETQSQGIVSNHFANQVNLYRSQIEANASLVSLYAQQVNAYQVQVSAYQAAVSAYTNTIQALASALGSSASQVESFLNIAGRCLASGQAKINEMAAMLGVKWEYPTTKLSGVSLTY